LRATGCLIKGQDASGKIGSMPLYYWIVVGCWLLFLVVWGVTALYTKKTIERKDRGRGWLLRALVVIGVFVSIKADLLPSWLLIPFVRFYPPLGPIGAVLTVIGTAFAIWARVYLGRNWGMPTSVKENTQLVTSGPYAYVRHPIYSGVILATLGSGLIAGGWWFFIFITTVGYFAYSAPIEEKILTEQFPTEYLAYKARTKMLIPYIL
jgi:protein-S-isoprenylcysteine O-methyltransferase Ste14